VNDGRLDGEDGASGARGNAACTEPLVMATIRSVSAWVATGAVLLAIGCERSASREPVAGTASPYGVTSRQSAATEAVVERLALARCSREQRCNNIGDVQRYPTYQVCVDRVRASVASDLNAYDCPHGIDQNALETCVRSLQTGDCRLSVSRLEQEVACRGRALCTR
jgi:hypothetical protein